MVLLLWVPLRQRPGPGTVANLVVVGAVVSGSLAVLPRPSGLGAQVSFLAAGVLGNGVATGLYIGADLGAGPRDGLMLGLARRGVSITRARTVIELSVLGAGFVLGGTVGPGTVVYALGIGPLAGVFIPALSRWGRATTTSARRASSARGWREVPCRS